MKVVHMAHEKKREMGGKIIFQSFCILTKHCPVKLGVHLQNVCGENNTVGGKPIFQCFCELTQKERKCVVSEQSLSREHKVSVENTVVLQEK